MALTSEDPLMTYVLLYFGKYQAIKDTDEYGATYLVNTWYPVGFAYWYEEILQSIPFKRADYDKHERLQELLRCEVGCSYYLHEERCVMNKLLSYSSLFVHKISINELWKLR